MCTVHAGDSVDRAASLIESSLARVVDGGISAQELARVQRSTRAQLLATAQSNSAMAAALASYHNLTGKLWASSDTRSITFAKGFPENKHMHVHVSMYYCCLESVRVAASATGCILQCVDAAGFEDKGWCLETCAWHQVALRSVLCALLVYLQEVGGVCWKSWRHWSS